MKKTPTLYLRNQTDRSRVSRAPNPQCDWVFAGEGMATPKWDGTCVMFDGTDWWARREVRPYKDPPPGWVQVEETLGGRRIGWEPAYMSPFKRFWMEAVDEDRFDPGTYELVGPKVNGNPHSLNQHMLVNHDHQSPVIVPTDYDGLRDWLEDYQFEGLVWHHRNDDRWAKIKRRDFGFPWPIEEER